MTDYPEVKCIRCKKPMDHYPEDMPLWWCRPCDMSARLVYDRTKYVVKN